MSKFSGTDNLCLYTRVSQMHMRMHTHRRVAAECILRYNRELDGNQLRAYCFEFRITIPKCLEIPRGRRINLVIPTRLIAWNSRDRRIRQKHLWKINLFEHRLLPPSCPSFADLSENRTLESYYNNNSWPITLKVHLDS